MERAKKGLFVLMAEGGVRSLRRNLNGPGEGSLGRRVTSAKVLCLVHL